MAVAIPRVQGSNVRGLWTPKQATHLNLLNSPYRSPLGPNSIVLVTGSLMAAAMDTPPGGEGRVT